MGPPTLTRGCICSIAGAGILFMFYGLYYGVLSRDVAELCSGWMASAIGFYAETDALPRKQPDKDICAICGDGLDHQCGPAWRWHPPPIGGRR